MSYQHSFPIVNDAGMTSQAFQRYLSQLDLCVLLKGDGSPEGALEAPQYSRYFDRTGVAGSRMYLKVHRSIANDPTMGWELE
jgi:hypothetical protein